MNGTLIKAIDSVGDPPLPIPNREVKPVSADGTAKIRGRVGHRHFSERELQAIEALFFLLLIPLVCSGLSRNLVWVILYLYNSFLGRNIIYQVRFYP